MIGVPSACSSKRLSYGVRKPTNKSALKKNIQDRVRKQNIYQSRSGKRNEKHRRESVPQCLWRGDETAQPPAPAQQAPAASSTRNQLLEQNDCQVEDFDAKRARLVDSDLWTQLVPESASRYYPEPDLAAFEWPFANDVEDLSEDEPPTLGDISQTVVYNTTEEPVEEPIAEQEQEQEQEEGNAKWKQFLFS